MPLRFLTAGESHGPAMVAILEGFPAGIYLDPEIVNPDLRRRQRGLGAGERMKIEKDGIQILSGVMAHKTTGGPITLMIENRDHKNWVGRSVAPYTVPRPGHADLAGAVKYGYADLRLVLERASARETAARVAVGGVCKHLLKQFNITVGGYITSIGDIEANLEGMSYEERIASAMRSDVGCPDTQAGAAIRSRIEEIIKDGDTLGGVIEVVALGLPPGLGSHVHWDRKLDSRIGAAILGIQAMKGVEIGTAFENTRHPGSQVHDPILLDGDELVRPTNRCGGLEGGITTGQPLQVRAAMKPIATTIKPQQSVNLASGKPEAIHYERSDYTPIVRAVSVVEAMLAYILADAMLEKLGGDSFEEIRPRFDALKKARLEDIVMQDENHTWWPA